MASIKEYLTKGLSILETKKQDAVTVAKNEYEKLMSNLGKVQSTIQKTENLPKFSFADKQKNPVVGSILQIPQGLLNTPSDFIRGVSRTGNDLGSMLSGNIKFNPLRLVSSVAPTASSILNVATMGVGKQIAQNIGKQTFKSIVNQGASSGAKYGGLFGGLSGLEQSRYEIPTNTIRNTALGAGLGTAIGGVAGGALAGAGYGINKGIRSYSAMDSLEKQRGSADLKPISDRVKQVHKLIFGDNRIPSSTRGVGSAEQNRYDDNSLLASQKVVDIINRKKANQKVNIFDYFRTPEKVFEKLGLKSESGLLRNGYDNYRKELKSEIDKVTQWSKRLPDKVSNERVFDFLDGKKVDLASDEMTVALEIKNHLSKWADRLNLPKDGRISNYITHIFEKGDIELEFNPDIAKMIENKVPGSVYNPFLEKRSNVDGYVRDTWRALDAYVKRATRKVNIDPALDRIEIASNKLDVESFKYIQRYITKVNMRPSEVDNLIDNGIKSLVGYKFTNRPTAYISKKVRQTIYRATLGLNPGSALRNISQGANTYAELGEKYTLKGYWDLTKRMATNDLSELYDVGVLDDQFIQDRSLHAVKQTMEKIDPVLFGMFEWAEKVNRGSAYFGAKARALAQGLSEEKAIETAKAVVRKTQFAFGSIDTPLAVQGDLTKIFTQFTGYSLKQAEFLLDKVMQKDFIGIARYTGAMFIFMGTIGKLLGMKPEEIIPSFRLKSPTVQLGEYALGSFNPDNRTSPFKALTGIGALIIPAGTQIKKTIEGLSTVNKGYSETPAGNIRFPVKQSLENYIRSGLFGQWNLPEGQKYLDDRSKSILEKFENKNNKLNNLYQEKYEKLVSSGHDKKQVKAFLLEKQKMEEIGKDGEIMYRLLIKKGNDPKKVYEFVKYKQEYKRLQKQSKSIVKSKKYSTREKKDKLNTNNAKIKRIKKKLKIKLGD